MIAWKVKYHPNKQKPTEIFIDVQENEGIGGDRFNRIEINHILVEFETSISLDCIENVDQVVALARLAWKLKKTQDKLGWGSRI